MKLSHALLLLSLAAITIALAVPDSAFAFQSEAVVSGRVIDEDGNPVAGATLVAVTAGDQEELRFDATSADDGTYRFPDLHQNVRYTMTVEKEGFTGVETLVVFDRRVNSRDFTLRYAGRQLAQEAYQRGVAAAQAGDFDAAAADITAAVEAIEGTVVDDQMLIAALGALAQVQFRRGDMDAAGAAYERVIVLVPDDVQAIYALGHVRDAQERYDEGEAAFRRVLEVMPSNAQAQYSLGSLLLRAGKPEAAVEPLEQAVQLQPEFPQAHRSLGNAHAQTGERDKAIEHLETYLQQMPDAPDAEQVQSLLAQLRG